MKYEVQVAGVRDQLLNAKNVLVALPTNLSVDSLAGGLALYLSLEQAGKKVAIVSDGTITVGNSNLFGIGQITNTLPKSGGNLTITLENVVAADGTVPALEKLDWYPEGSNLNLVFHVLPGQNFQPSQIIPHYQGGSFDLIFVLGAASLADLGTVYSLNHQAFSGVPMVNIDTSLANTQFAPTNLVDAGASSLSEIMYQVMVDLGLNVDADSSTNLLTGIYDVTHNLTQNVKPDTFIVLGQAMQAGGRVPQAPATTQPATVPQPTPTQPVSQPVAAAQPQPAAPQPTVLPQSQAGQTIQGTTPLIDSTNLPQWLNFPASTTNSPAQPTSTQPAQDQFTNPPLVNAIPQLSEEQPVGEQAVTSSSETDSPSPDWLTPKIFKGSNLE